VQCRPRTLLWVPARLPIERCTPLAHPSLRMAPYRRLALALLASTLAARGAALPSEPLKAKAAGGSSSPVPSYPAVAPLVEETRAPHLAAFWHIAVMSDK
jgi:hypothetical protein